MDLSKYSVILLFAITLTTSVTNTIVKNWAFKCFFKDNKGIYLFNTFSSIITTFVIFACAGFDLHMSTFTLLLGIAFGLVTALSSVLGAFTVRLGPVSYSQIILNMSTLITALSGFFFWGEDLPFVKIIGVVMMVICLVLSVDTSKEEGKSTNIKWFILCIICLLLSASIGIMQKIHQGSEHKSELMQFLTVAFAISIIYSFVGYLIAKNKAQPETVVSNKKNIYLFAIISAVLGLCVASNNVINLYLSGVVDSAIFFPLVNGIPLMAILLFSFIFFKERFKGKKLIGFIIGALAIVMLTVF